jgi:hypothetical protein
MTVRVFCNNEPDLTNIGCDAKFLAGQLATRFIGQIQGGGKPEWTMSIKTMEVKDRAQMHCDKWVEEVGVHFALYSSARLSTDVPSLSVPSIARSDREVMKYKVYSGDVSGVIGESLFSLFLTKQFGLLDDNFAHLRADKSSGIYPDFGIYKPTQALLKRLHWRSGMVNTRPIPAEVKTANNPSRQSIKPQLEKAILQIRNYWFRMGPPPEPSIICLAIRNPNNQSYDLCVIWGA